MKTDPINMEIIRSAILAIAEGTRLLLIETAFSPNIRERHDCSAAVFNPAGELIAQTAQIPLHLGVMSAMVKKALEVFPVERLSPGDALICNDPYHNGTHLPDICMITPVFLGDDPLAILANIANHVDLGGSVPGSMSTVATEIYQEGVRIPPLKICKKGATDMEVLELLAHNVRTGEVFRGDLLAQLAANRFGEKRLLELEHKTGMNLLGYNLKEIINEAEKRLLAALSDVPAGRYEFEDYLEGDGVNDYPLKIALNLELAPDKILADFTGTSPQTKGPGNATPAIARACVLYAIKAAFDPELPLNEGIERVVEVVVPAGSLLNPAFPAPVAHGGVNTAQRVADTVLGALAKALPHRVTAAGAGSMNCLTIGGLTENQEYYSFVETNGGGQGAKCGQDGMDGVQVNMTNAMNTPIEILESSYPLRVEQYALIPDSGGAGQFRGGAGLIREIRLLADAYVSISSERNSIRPWGLEGGAPGQTAKCYLEEAGSGKRRIPGKFTGELPAGTVITLETAGGGGYGPPEERSTKAAETDLSEGLVTPTET